MIRTWLAAGMALAMMTGVAVAQTSSTTTTSTQTTAPVPAPVYGSSSSSSSQQTIDSNGVQTDKHPDLLERHHRHAVRHCGDHPEDDRFDNHPLAGRHLAAEQFQCPASKFADRMVAGGPIRIGVTTRSNAREPHNDR